MLANIERFREKWEHISAHATKEGLLKDSFGHQIENLKEHITKGCLSNIPVGYSTSVNECLHEKINDLFAGSKMGPELAMALLTVFFYSWNSRKNNRINGLPIVLPLEKSISTAKENERKECFGLGSAKGMSDPVIISDQATEQETSCDNLVARAVSMLKFFQGMKTKSNNPRDQMSIYQLFFEGEIINYLLKSTTFSNHGHSVETKECSRQPQIAATFGMKVVEVPKDGDCLFTSVAMSLVQLFADTSKENPIVSHLTSLNISTASTIESLAGHLRSLMVSELLRQKQLYEGFLGNDNKKNYEKIVLSLNESGTFSGDAGDLMVKALSNVLQVPIVLLKSIENFPVITITPEHFKETDFCIYLSFQRDGPGHYNAVLEDKDGSSKSSLRKEETKYCSCGSSNATKGKPVCSSSFVEDSQRKYTSRCPCLRNQRCCSDSCRCKGCCNPHGEKPTTVHATNKRKRKRHEFSTKRMGSIEYLLKEEVEIEVGKWTEGENAILLQLLHEHPDVMTSDMATLDSFESLTKRYNGCVESALKECIGVKDLRPKTRRAVEQKIAHLKKQKELLYLYLAEQLKTFMGELA